MHPPRLVSLCCLVQGLLSDTVVGFAGGVSPTIGLTLQLIGGVLLIAGGIYGLVRHGDNPIMTEYGPITYLILLGFGFWIVGPLAQLHRL